MGACSIDDAPPVFGGSQPTDDASADPLVRDAGSSGQTVDAGDDPDYRQRRDVVTVDGLEQRFLVVEPRRASSAKLPIVVMYHGDTGTAQGFQQQWQFERAAGQGALTGERPVTPFFRFPGFADTPETLAWLDARDIAVFGADLWASDWLAQTPQAQLELTMRRLAATGRGILLLHDIRAQTVAMLPVLLRRLKREGYRIVHLQPGATKPALREPPAGWKSETGDFLERYMPHLGPPADARSGPPRAQGG